MTYKELLEKLQTEANEMSKDKIFFFFGSENEIKDKMKAKGLQPNDLVYLGAGGYVKKEYADEVNTFLDNQQQQKKDYALANPYEVVKHYCRDYEIEISLSYTYLDVVYILMDFTKEEALERKDEINRAFKDYKREFYEVN